MAKYSPPPSFGDFLEKHYPGLVKQTDQGLALIGVGYLESLLFQIFQSRFIDEDPKGGMNAILAVDGPLGSMRNRTEFAYFLGWIPNQLRSDLNKLGSIRNDFAHTINQQISFSDQAISSKVNGLTIASYYKELKRSAISSVTDPATLKLVTEDFDEQIRNSRLMFVIALSQSFMLLEELIRGGHHAKENTAGWEVVTDTTARKDGESAEFDLPYMRYSPTTPETD